MVCVRDQFQIPYQLPTFVYTLDPQFVGKGISESKNCITVALSSLQIKNGE